MGNDRVFGPFSTSLSSYLNFGSRHSKTITALHLDEEMFDKLDEVKQVLNEMVIRSTWLREVQTAIEKM